MIVSTSTDWPYKPWDYCLSWHLEQTEAEGPDFSQDPLTLDIVKDDHLRVASGNDENRYIESLIRVSYRMAERTTWRALLPQTLRLVLHGFPVGSVPIRLPKPPLIGVDGISYTDGELTGSPAQFVVEAPGGASASKGFVNPLYGSSWPSVTSQSGAVTVTYRAGYPIGEDGLALIPEDINHGRLLMIGELYKHRSLSDHSFNQNPALIQAKEIWLGYRAY